MKPSCFLCHLVKQLYIKLNYYNTLTFLFLSFFFFFLLRVFFRTRATRGGRDPHGASPAGHAPNGAPPSGPPCGRAPTMPLPAALPAAASPTALLLAAWPATMPLPATRAPHGTRACSRTWRHPHPAGGGVKLLSDAPARQQQPCSVHRATPPASCGPAGHAAGCCCCTLSQCCLGKSLACWAPHVLAKVGISYFFPLYFNSSLCERMRKIVSPMNLILKRVFGKKQLMKLLVKLC